MFTGIVEEVGQVAALEHRGDSAVLTIRATKVTSDLVHGASIAVNGVCLTVVGWTAEGELTAVDFDVMGETLRRSVIGGLGEGTRVNLERSVRADQRLDGHVVQGHVDGTGAVVSRTSGDNWDTVRVEVPAELARFVAEKGSIAVDGVSLTVSAVGPDWFEVGLIPETLRATTLGGKAAGDPVNLEVDVLAKYVARLLATEAAR
ncbi:riboflavin synthase alpha chain [Jatrophihabitans endophyticus]|uniref:Riboflavin synthase n=1 Tax=Jatrophihabitans endophyticus TaxID=1206085 RepID=A0A1M5LSZ5_9ACTN|nr:riboflavin synthase [Jatrophihabitans endophyticus]SHG68252.1 riboflavin synthase alpha chain [Jatrophihabitans endophyticus]